MPQAEATATAEQNDGPDASALDGGAYEIIRNRLRTGGDQLRERLEKLNAARKEIFGAIDFSLLATDRISTRNNCLPRDMAPLGGDRFLFGYNVRMGLKSETEIGDVFSVYAYRDQAFSELDPAAGDHPLADERFERDFAGLYKYYRDTRFSKFSVIGGHLFMVFHIGKSAGDIKTFKWRMTDGGLQYVDNRSDHQFKYPPQHQFEWTRTHRDLHRFGRHPHISIQDRVFVEAVGGDITFKVEDNTEDGQGIYSEPVDDPDQTLDDAEIFYAAVGNMILARIKPYMESEFRHFIFNEKTREVHRVDAIRDACVLLPDGHGVIFSSGYYLQTGELKKFESHIAGMRHETKVASANGEDHLYVFHHPESGDYALLSYNVIEQKVESPVPCNGYSVFEDGRMLIFRATREPARHHAVQVWQTPYISSDYALTRKTERSDAYLFKIGNPDIVRCMAECSELLKLLGREDDYDGLYMDMVKKAGDIADTYFWLGRKEAFDIKSTLTAIRSAAAGAIEEYEKVRRMKEHTRSEVARVSEKAETILTETRARTIDHIDAFVESLSALRGARGELISLKELRHVDLGAVDALEDSVTAATDDLSGRCVSFLLNPESLKPYQERVEAIQATIEGLERVVDADAAQKEIDAAGAGLEMLIDIVSNLKIADATRTTRIIDNISAIYSRLNGAQASLKNRRKLLRGEEGAAQFNALIKLLNQSVINYLDISDTPAKCDDYLTRVMVQIEELEGRFADFDDFILDLSEKRDELRNAFETRKLSLVEARGKKAATLLSAAERIIKGIGNRIAGLDNIDAINAYFASDMMVEKIRNIVAQLLELEDTVKADDIQSRLKSAREDAVRQLKDRKDLFVDGANVIRMGDHHFTVNVRPLDLTVVPREGGQWFHLTGTNFFSPINDPEFEATRPAWEMTVPSESAAVYRAEYLAYRMLMEMTAAPVERDSDSADQWIERVRTFMGPRYTEGYTKGVHDADGARILSALRDIHVNIGLLRFPPGQRVLARLYWELMADKDARSRMEHRLTAFGAMQRLFSLRSQQKRYLSELERGIAEFAESTGLFPSSLAPGAAAYLFAEKTSGPGFAISRPASDIARDFNALLLEKQSDKTFAEAREKLRETPAGEFELIRDWVRGYVESSMDAGARTFMDEAAALVFFKDWAATARIDAPMAVDIDGMAGDHAVIAGGRYRLDYLDFMDRMGRHEAEAAPLFNRYQALKKTLTDAMRHDMRLDEFKPRVLSSFVRNRLINRVYLPLIGSNLAKQIGVAGEAKRTDLMGLLLLISPPGYGKTTLMEYIANRLGIIFMKINGPAISNRVTSLDPAEAPFASAREEIEKLNLALEMGDNVMLYLDDIQHCNPELLQKFISLCDAQRKIEGIYKGRARTYDLRGRKVAVVMAGNPYTESGEKFKIPDMLANRADTYNLGDIIGDSAEDFKMSYLENALTSNPALNALASRSQRDVYGIIQIAETGQREGVELTGAYSREQVEEMVSVMKKLIAIRDVILKVNKEYILSAGQSDEYRTEPAFRLQGSYRNMNRLTEKVAPLMNEAELKTLILSHYENEAQTLTTGAEANLLKFKELTGWATAADAKRWEEIKKTFGKNQLFRGGDAGDPVNKVVARLSAFQDGLEAIKSAIESGIDRLSGPERSDRPGHSDWAGHSDWKDGSDRPDGSDRANRSTPVSLSPETLAQLSALAKSLAQPTMDVDAVAAAAARAGAPMMPHATRVIHKTPKNYYYKAIKFGDDEAVAQLLEEGKDPNITTREGATPLMAAAFHDHPEIVRLLVTHGASINAQDRDGYTALMIAASRGHLETAETLLAHGADRDLLDKDGLAALDWAEKNGHTGVAVLLKDERTSAFR